MGEFVVHAIEKTYSGLKLTLREYTPPPEPEPEEPEETYTPMPDPLETFVAETDEEKVLLKFFKAMKKFGIDFSPPPRPIPYKPTKLYPISTVESTLYLSDEEYKEIGMPGLGQRLTLTLKKVE